MSTLASQVDWTITEHLICKFLPLVSMIRVTSSYSPHNWYVVFLKCRNWELTAPWTGSKIEVPVKFIVGDLDITYNAAGVKDYIHKGGLKKDVPLLEDVVILKGVAHFLQQEKPDEVNKHIHVFFQGLSSSDWNFFFFFFADWNFCTLKLHKTRKWSCTRIISYALTNSCTHPMYPFPNSII